MKKIFLLLIYILFILNTCWGQSGKWSFNMDCYLHNPKDYEAYKESRLIIWLSENGSGWNTVMEEAVRTPKYSWNFRQINRRDYNLTDRISAIKIYSKLERNNAGDPPNGDRYINNFQTLSQSIGYRQYIYSNDQVYYTWQGRIEMYVYPKDINIVYKSGVSQILPALDKIKFEAPSGYTSDTYKWVYSADNGSAWREISNSSLQGNRILEVSGKDVYGDNYENIMNFSGNTWIALEYYVYKDKDNPKIVQHSNYFSLTNQRTAPHIMDTVVTDNKCYGKREGSVKVILDRALKSGEKLAIYGGPDRLDLTSLDSDNSFTIRNLSSGSYDIQISGFYASDDKPMYSDGIGHKKKVIISSPPALSYQSKDSVNISCHGFNNGSFTVSASGGDGGYQLYWKKEEDASYSNQSFSSASQVTISNLSPGAYRYYVVDKHNCELRNNDQTIYTIPVTLTQPAKALAFAFLASVPPSGYGKNNGSITIEGDGGTPIGTNSYTVTWKNKQTNQPVTNVENDPSGAKFRSKAINLPKGTYIAEIKDKNNCTQSIEVTIEEPPLLAVTVGETQSILCNGDSNGQLTVHAVGGVLANGQSYTYQWYKKNGSVYQPIERTANIASGLGYGDYKVEVKDKSREPNTATFEFTLNQPTQLLATYTKQDVTCYGGNNGSINVSVSGGVGNYKLYYKERDDNDYGQPIAPQGNVFQINNLPKGEYRFYIEDGNLCNASISGTIVATAIINQPAAPLEISEATTKPASGFGRSDGNISIKVKGGTQNNSAPYYTVVWKNSSNTTLPSTESFDSYGVFTSKIDNLQQGTYTVQVKDKNYAGLDNACYTTATFTVVEPEPLVVALENTNGVYCYGETTGQLIAHVSGGVPKTMSTLPYTYKWYEIVNNNEVLISAQTDSILSNRTSGYYKVKIEDASIPVNQTESGVFHIEQPTLLTTVLTTRNIYCHGLNDGFIHITVSGGVGSYKLYCKQEGVDTDYRQYQISNDNRTFALDNLNAGKYIIYIIDGNNCYAKINGEDIHETILSQPAAPLVISSMSKTDVSGFARPDGSIDVVIEGGTPNTDNTYNVTWKNGQGQTLSSGYTFKNGKYISLLVQVPKGTYTIEITDKNFAGAYPTENASCTITETYFLPEPDELLGNIEETHFVSCNGMSDGQLIAHIRGGIKNSNSDRLPYKYQWYKEASNGTYKIMLNEQDSVLQSVPKGKYKVVIEDYSRITNTISIIYDLVQPDLLQANATNTSIICGQTTDISVDVTGGTAPYTYQWNTGDLTQTVQGVEAGVYLVFITDSRGCQTTAVARVSIPSSLNVEGVAANPVCNGASNGNISLQVAGGTAPYIYKWNTGSTGKDLNNAKAGLYSVKVTDSDGCSFTQSFFLSDPEPLTISLGEDRTLCNGQTLRLAPSVADAKTTFRWTGTNSFASSGREVELSKAGKYKLAITDSKGCQASDEININVKNTDISSEIVIASQVFVNDTIIIVNISSPEPDSVEWLIKESESLQIVEKSKHYAKVVFSQTGHYSIGSRSHIQGCFQDIVKNVTVTDSDGTTTDMFGESIIKEFTVYPNPSDGNFHVKIGLNKSSAIRLRIINIGTGNIISDVKYSARQDYDIPYNLVASPGAYVVLLETASGRMNLRLIIK